MAEVDQTNAKDTLLGVLGYIDSPFKLFVVLLLALSGFVGYFIYANQAVLIGAYQKNQELPKMNLSRADDVSAIIIKETGADLVAIFNVNPVLGKRVLERAYTRDGRYKALDGIDTGLFTSNQNNNYDLIRLMGAEVPCNHYSSAQSEIGLWYLSQGVTFMCRVSVPPEINAFIGQVSVGWKEVPKDLYKVQGILELTSRMLVK